MLVKYVRIILRMVKISIQKPPSLRESGELHKKRRRNIESLPLYLDIIHHIIKTPLFFFRSWTFRTHISVPRLAISTH